MEREEVTSSHRYQVLLLSLLIALILVVVLRNAWVSDDSYISFRAVDNLVHGYGLRWNVDERVQGFTNPLWVFLMAPFHLLTGEMYFTAIFVSIAVTLAMLILLAGRLAIDFRAAILALVILFFSKAWVDYSTSGLENPLTNLLLVLFFAIYFRREWSPRTYFWLAFVAALGVCTRMDTILLYAPLLIYGFFQIPWRRALKAGLAGFSPFILWELFSIVYYGFPFPNTYYAKLKAGIPSADLFRQGAVYFVDNLASDPILPFTIVAAVVAVIALRMRRLYPIVIGIVLYLLYVGRVGGDFMSGRMLVAPLVCAVIVLARVRLPERPFALPAVLSLFVLIGIFSPDPPVSSGRLSGQEAKGLIRADGIADERLFYYNATSLMAVTRDTIEPRHIWALRGIEDRWSDVGATTSETVGFEGFFAGPKVHIVDPNALTDPLLARLPCYQRYGWRIGHLTRVVPSGYFETVRDDSNQIANPALARYYDALAVIVRGPVWSFDRFRTIWRMTFGGYDSLLNEYAYPPALEVNYDQISEPKAQGTPWDAPGNFVIRPPNGVIIKLDSLSHSRRVEFSVDNDDEYVAVFYRDAKKLGQERIIKRVVPGGGLRVDVLTLPGFIHKTGYNRIQIFPQAGNDQFSVGHVRLW